MSGKRCKALRAAFRREHGRAVLVTRWERTALGYRVLKIPDVSIAERRNMKGSLVTVITAAEPAVALGAVVARTAAEPVSYPGEAKR